MRKTEHPAGLEISGNALEIYPPDELAANLSARPLIAIRHFSFHSGIAGLFIKPMHVNAVMGAGLRIEIPPRTGKNRWPDNSRLRNGKVNISLDRIICEDSELRKPGG